jgi:hypothetical protein
MSGFDWMWVWWTGTVVLCAWKLIEGAIFRPVRMLEWPFLACTMWIYFFGYMGYKAKLTLSAYLGHGMDNIGQLMDLLCLIGLLAGWSVGKRIPVKASRQVTEYPYGYCWCAGLFFVLVGAVGNYSVSHAAGEGTLNYRAASAYWYLLYYVGYPGLAIALWAALKIKSRAVSYTLLAVTAVALVIYMMPQLVSARRGPLFPAIIALLLVPPLTLRRPPNRWIYCGGLAALGVVMLLFIQVRVTIYNGGTWSEAFQKLDVSDAVVDRGDDAYDNEYVNNCQVIGTVFQTGKYEYGTGHLELLVHWVPRALWHAKPSLGEGYYGGDSLFDDMEEATGVRLLGAGAADAGVADSFLEYGCLCPLFWFGLSCGLGVVYAKVLCTRSPWWMFCYVGFLCSSHWLISQSFCAAYVPGWYFQLVPLAVLASIPLYRRWFEPRPKLGMGRRLQPQRALTS